MKRGNLRVRESIPLILITVLLCPIVYGKVIYVDDDAVGINNGLFDLCQPLGTSRFRLGHGVFQELGYAAACQRRCWRAGKLEAYPTR